MNVLDHSSIEQIRDRYRNRTAPSELLRETARLTPPERPHKLELMANLRADLSASKPHRRLGTWRHGGYSRTLSLMAT